ncbi:hypothetical protein COMA1_11354 [Candidatus Nitrospira nitrosa]|uniref:Uncharacterized protein n=1 Tax=Candidatus Nitrospira nitrosa TaxID=1742972 RepID=A0A0S4LD27_9BACT|nr:hypothetical protein COMA1_11354 [Candidatus Nitrospira nitrosa]
MELRVPQMMAGRVGRAFPLNMLRGRLAWVVGFRFARVSSRFNRSTLQTWED